MNEGLIPRRYAKALLKLASEHGTAQRVYGLMSALADAFEAESMLRTMTANPFVPVVDKEKILVSTAGASASDTIFSDFIRLLDKNRRMAMMRECALAYIELYRKTNKIFRVEISSASELDPSQQSRLLDLIGKHLGEGKPEYVFHVDPSLIGGFVVKIENERLDASVANELAQLRQKLLG